MQILGVGIGRAVDPVGEPADWIVHGGKPAAVIGDGFPSYEWADGRDKGLLIFDLLAVVASPTSAEMRSHWYETAALLAPEGPCPVHHAPTALWSYRPCFYTKHMRFSWIGLGSQVELEWRHGLHWATHIVHGDADGARDARLELAKRALAEAKAKVILFAHLTPQQRIECLATGNFRCRGAATGNLYMVEFGNGFAILDPITNEKTVSYCLHPEYWMPHEDVMLTHKLALEDEELEVEYLENANMTLLKHNGRATPADRLCAKYERELIA